MTAVQTTRGVKLILKVGNGASPEVFTPWCSINAERGLTFNSQTSEETIEDCDDPEQIGWIVREKTSLSVGFTGAGMHHKKDTKKMWDFWKSEDPKNCQVVLDDDVSSNVIVFEGPFHLTDFELTGTKREKVKSSITMASDGEVTGTFGSSVD